jgi:hypothetical protein
MVMKMSAVEAAAHLVDDLGIAAIENSMPGTESAMMRAERPATGSSRGGSA